MRTNASEGNLTATSERAPLAKRGFSPMRKKIAELGGNHDTSLGPGRTT